jgi:DtxR family Mn-dependent transcriptional regulator
MTPKPDLSPAIQDYLRAVYKLSRRLPEGERVTTNQLAERLGVKPASVTVMLQRLAAADPPLLYYHKHQGVSLTPAGEQAALGVVRHHRLLEQYLHEKLGYSWDEVHDEADRLEHVASDQLIARMAAALSYPTHDPHGHAIPAEDLSLAHSIALSLDQLAIGDRAIIQSVRDEDPQLLRYLDQIGLRPGTHIRLIDVQPLNKLYVIAVGPADDECTVGTSVATQVFVRPMDDSHVS